MDSIILRIVISTNEVPRWNEAVLAAISLFGIDEYTDSEIVFSETDNPHEMFTEIEMRVEDRSEFTDRLLAFGDYCGDLICIKVMEVTIPVTIDVKLEREDWGKIDSFDQGQLIASFAVDYQAEVEA